MLIILMAVMDLQVHTHVKTYTLNLHISKTYTFGGILLYVDYTSINSFLKNILSHFSYKINIINSKNLLPLLNNLYLKKF